jgi:hypothetical protein
MSVIYPMTTTGMKPKIYLPLLMILLANSAFAQKKFAIGLNWQFCYDFISVNSSSKTIKQDAFPYQMTMTPGVSIRYSWNPYWNMELGGDLMSYVTSFHADFPNGHASAALAIGSPRLIYMVNYKVLQQRSEYIAVGAGFAYQHIPAGGGDGYMSAEGTAAAPGVPATNTESVYDSLSSPSLHVLYPNFSIGIGKEFEKGNELAIRFNYQYGYKTILDDRIKAISNVTSYDADIKNKGSFFSLGIYYTFRPIGSKRKAKA